MVCQQKTKRRMRRWCVEDGSSLRSLPLMISIANTWLRGSDCPSSRHPLSVRCTYPAGSFQMSWMAACLLACTYLTVGHVLAESSAVGLDVVAGLEVGILRGRVECVGHGCVWSRAHVRGVVELG